MWVIKARMENQTVKLKWGTGTSCFTEIRVSKIRAPVWGSLKYFGVYTYKGTPDSWDYKTSACYFG